MDGYRARRTLFETESAFTLEGGSLVRATDKGEVQRLALADVRQVRISYQPLTMFDRWVCSVEGPAGRIWIPSASFTGPARAEDRRVAYRAFVEGLNQAIAAAPSAAPRTFVQGNAFSGSFALFMLVVLWILIALLLLGVVGSMMGGGSFAWAVLPVIVCLWSSRMLWRIWRRNHTGSFDPRALPATFAA